MITAQQFEDRKQQILNKCADLIDAAEALYSITLPHIDISFNLRGTVAGWAGRENGKYWMKFNSDMIANDSFDHILNDAISHELAHIVCYFNPYLGKNHNYGWQQVCKSLGGNGKRCHSEKVNYAKGDTFEYVSSTGKKHKVSQIIHNRIQQNHRMWYNYRNGGGRIDWTSSWENLNTGAKSTTSSTFLPGVTIIRTSPPTITIPHPSQSTKPVFDTGTSKAAQARNIMSSWYTAGKTYEQIIAEIQRVTGHDRQLARATYKANAPKVNVPQQF